MKFKIRLPRLPRLSRRVLGWGAWALAVIVLWTVAPVLLRQMAFFRVRQVEIVGMRYLDASVILDALRLAPGASVFDDTQVLTARVRALPGVADAAVVRRPPGSLKVIVREIEPVALVADARGALTVVDAEGRVLPFDPSRPGPAGGGGLDLPIVRSADSAVVSVLARVQALEPALFQDIDAARRGAGALPREVVLELGSHRVLLAADAGAEAIQAVVLVAKDLAARARPYAELDGRYAGQVVVRRRSARSA